MQGANDETYQMDTRGVSAWATPQRSVAQ